MGKIRRSGALAGATGFAVLVVSGCAGPAAGPDPSPQSAGARRERPDRVRVLHVAERSPYLDVHLGPFGERPPRARRLFVRATPECREVLAAPRLRLADLGYFGLFVDPDARRFCEPIGTTPMLLAEALRDTRLRARRSRHAPHSQAEFEPFAADPSVVQVRGRFPLASEIRWAAPMDAVAWLPAVPPCRAIAASRSATLELRVDEEVPLWLIGPEGPCPIVGLALPP